MWRSALVAACLLVIGPSAVAASGLVSSLLAGIARTPPVSTPFVAVSYRRVLVRPLVVSGILRWLGGDRLQRDVQKPYQETAKVAHGEVSVQRGGGQIHQIPLDRVPQLGAVLTGFRALLGGNVAALEQVFTLSAQGSQARWAITLTPRHPQLALQLSSIEIDGRHHAPRCFTVHDTDGDTTITLLGSMAVAGLRTAMPSRSALAARCRD